MPSQTIINLQNQLAKLQGQINTLLDQQVLLDHSVDGQSFQLHANMIASLKEQHELITTIFKGLPFEKVTRTLITY